MKRHLGTVLLTLSTLGRAAAQDAGSTLAALAERADLVVRATVVAATDPSPQWHRMQFASVQVLKGTAAATFELLEPAGACCGRSLFALQIGDERLLFLRRTGQTLHPLGGARGVLPAAAAVVAHVSALLAAPDAAARAAVLTAGLAADAPRVADDAAQALSTLPQLSLGSPQRAAITTALGDAVRRGSTRTAPLVEVLARLGDDASLDACLPIYLDTPRDDQAALLRRGLARGGTLAVATRLPLHVDRDDQRVQRAAELLAELPPEHARPALQRLLLAAPHPRVQLTLTAGLLAAGLRPAELAPLVPAPVLELAQNRHDRPRPLRVVRPDRK
ncbi:MAG: hypothetical protein JNN13_07320 [Planctomycetes bacterium]|nr:hypothetical protein [Planctomycetota bacterium]